MSASGDVAARRPAALPGVSTVWDLVAWRAAESPGGLFALDERGRRLSFGDLRSSALSVAAGLAERGVGPGTTVAWQLPTWLESMVLCCALARLGARQVPLIPSYRGREFRFVLERTGAALCIVPDRWGGFDYGAMAADARPAGTALLVLDADTRSLPEGDPGRLAHPPPPESAGDERWLYFTSGTTGDPKGARHADATLFGAVPGMLAMLEPGPQDRNSMVFPFAHIGGAVWLLTGLVSGCAHLLAERFDPARTIPMLAANHVTLAGSGTPFNLAYLAAQRALAAEHPGARLFPEVRLFMSGASPKPAHLHATMAAELGAGIASSYGLTEAPILTACGPHAPDAKRATTEGVAAPGVGLEVVGPDGSPLAPGVEGEVAVRGPQVCLGYIDPTHDAAFDDRGRLRTGDLGILDDEGYLTVTGRLKDVIIRKGENISAKEVEDLLYEHPGVGDVAVIGLPDPALGEMACAVVVPAPGAPPLAFEDMVGFLRSRQLMTQKIPERLELLAVLPRNASGKVLKQELQRRFGPG